MKTKVREHIRMTKKGKARVRHHYRKLKNRGAGKLSDLIDKEQMLHQNLKMGNFTKFNNLKEFRKWQAEDTDWLLGKHKKISKNNAVFDIPPAQLDVQTQANIRAEIMDEQLEKRRLKKLMRAINDENNFFKNRGASITDEYGTAQRERKEDKFLSFISKKSKESRPDTKFVRVKETPDGIKLKPNLLSRPRSRYNRYQRNDYEVIFVRKGNKLRVDKTPIHAKTHGLNQWQASKDIKRRIPFPIAIKKIKKIGRHNPYENNFKEYRQRQEVQESRKHGVKERMLEYNKQRKSARIKTMIKHIVNSDENNSP